MKAFTAEVYDVILAGLGYFWAYLHLLYSLLHAQKLYGILDSFSALYCFDDHFICLVVELSIELWEHLLKVIDQALWIGSDLIVELVELFLINFHFCFYFDIKIINEIKF